MLMLKSTHRRVVAETYRKLDLNRKLADERATALGDITIELSEEKKRNSRLLCRLAEKVAECERVHADNEALGKMVRNLNAELTPFLARREKAKANLRQFKIKEVA